MSNKKVTLETTLHYRLVSADISPLLLQLYSFQDFYKIRKAL